MKVVNEQLSVVSEVNGLWSVIHFCFALCAMLSALCCSVEAQQPMKVVRIGYLSGGGSPESSARAAFVQTLKTLRQQTREGEQ